MAQGDVALIVGAGSGLSASLARQAADAGMTVALAARNSDKLADLCAETGARAYACDAARPDQVAGLFSALEADLGVPDLVVYNASARVRGPFVELDPAGVENTLMVTCYGAFLVAQAAARLMVPRGKGAIFLTGASAGVKGYPQSAPFAMGKFGLRGLAQSMARELQPQGLHIAHFVIDGGIGESPPEAPDSRLHPDEIARTYFDVYRQHRSAWAWEIELRPWVERF